MRNESVVKMITVTLLGILALWLISSLFLGTGMGIGFRGYYGGGHMNMGVGFGYGSSIGYLMLLLMKGLFIVFVISLVAGFVMWIKNNVFTAEEIDSIKNTFRGNKTACCGEKCAACGKDIEADWKLCPHCGKEK